MNSRRQFLLKLTSIPLFLSSAKLLACDAAKISSEAVKKKIFDASSGSAKRLDFVSIAEQAKSSKYQKGQKCGQCKFFNSKTQEGEFAKCSFARNRYVPSCGWCKQFKKDPKKS